MPTSHPDPIRRLCKRLALLGLAALPALASASTLPTPSLANIVTELNRQQATYTSVRQALFGLNADGSANAGSLGSLSWNPSHDSSYWTVLDSSSNQPILPANWRYRGASASGGETLAVTGTHPGTQGRYAAFGGNPLGVPGNAVMDKLMLNTLAWLTRRSSPAELAGLRVVTAHLPGAETYWFSHETKVRSWLAERVPGVLLNGRRSADQADNLCDGAKLDACLQEADLLVIGRESVLHERVATHEFAFQVLAREAVSFNEFRRFPLLKALDWLETNFRPYNPEKEVQVGLFRVPIPKVDMGAFREAVANALVHRDYHRLGAVHVRLDDHGLTISNPGGLVDGVTLHNLLTTAPRPRNPALADAMKRIGIVERSGRGVDKIYRGMLRFGRPEPDYSRTDSNSVVLQLATVEADEVFLQLIIGQENRLSGTALPIDSLIALAVLREQKRLGMDELAQHIHRDSTQARRTLESLVEAGLVQPHGNTRNRSYTLSAEVYQAKGQHVAYTRQAGFSSLQNEQMVLSHVRHHGQIRRSEVIDLCHLTDDQAAKLLKRLKDEGRLVKSGERRWTFYTLNELL